MHRAPGRLWTCPGALGSPDAREAVCYRSRVSRSFWDFGWRPLFHGGMGRQTPPRNRRSPWPGIADGGVAALSLSGATRETFSSASVRHAARPGRPLIGAGAAPIRDGLVRWWRGCATCHRGFAGLGAVSGKAFRGFGPRRERQSAVTSRPARAYTSASAMASINASCTRVAVGICQPHTSGRTRQCTTPC